MCDLKIMGKKIKELRTKSNLTQSIVAEFLSVDQSLIAKIEKGERNINVDMIEKLSELFCCPIEYILDEEEYDDSCTIAFRKKDIEDINLEALAVINKIVLNQFEMDKIKRGRK